MKDWNAEKAYEENDIIDWYKLITSIDDQKLQKICGTDTALYLIWLRYATVFFGVISLMNIVLVIVYYNGEPMKQDDFKNSG